MMRELGNIVWHNNRQPVLCRVDLSDLQNLHVITEDITGHLERCHVDNLNIRVFQTENSAQLCVLSLQELLHRNSLKLFD